MTWTLEELSVLLGARRYGPPSLLISRLISYDETDPAGLAFCEDGRSLAKSGGAGVVLIAPGLDPGDRPHLVHDDPRTAFESLMSALDSPVQLPPGQHPASIADPGAAIDPTASIGAFTIIGANTVVGAGVQIFPHCYIGPDCSIGEDTIVHANAVLYQRVHLGRRNVIHSGAVLGGPGFGHFRGEGSPRTVAHLGQVVTGDDVEIGACTTIDRAKLGATSIGSGTKIDNQVQVGHNVTIGRDVVIAGQSGIAGSTVVADGVLIGGAASIRDHVYIGPGVQVAGGSGVAGDLQKPGPYFGYPARPLAEALRIAALLPRLAQLFERVKRLEQQGQ